MKRTPIILVTVGTLTTAALVGTGLASGGGGLTSGGSAPLPVAATPTRGAQSTGSTGAPATGNPPVTLKRAADIALAHLGGGTVVEIEQEEIEQEEIERDEIERDGIDQERQHGRTVWSVRLLKDGIRHRVDVDRTTGQITRTERTDCGDDDHDDDEGRPSVTDDREGDRDDDHAGRQGTDDNDSCDDE